MRSAAGLFDLSHMGELLVEGPGAAAGLARALVGDPGRLAVGRARYTLLCAPDGGVIDDLIVYRLAPERFLVVPNASNAAVVATVLRERLAGQAASLADESAATSLVAIQGPAAATILGPLATTDVAAIPTYGIADGVVAGIPARIARTGYTGEDGFELFVAWDAGPALWDRLLDAGAGAGLVPAGLGARDTLRLEAGMPLYGHELDLEHTPLETGLARFVELDRPDDFVGRAALEANRDHPRSRLAGLRRPSNQPAEPVLSIEAAVVIGVPEWKILSRHIFPNITAPILVLGSVDIGTAILAEASLGFLGIGIAPPAISWGSMLSRTGLKFLETAPMLAIYPGLAIGLTVFGVNILGDALRDVLDPRLRQR